MGIFAAVVDEGSFTQAARTLNIPKSTVSTKVSQLEKSLGVDLLVRTTRSISLTCDGEVYIEYCRRILQQAISANRAISSQGETVAGLIRITSSTSLGVS